MAKVLHHYIGDKLTPETEAEIAANFGAGKVHVLMPGDRLDVANLAGYVVLSVTEDKTIRDVTVL